MSENTKNYARELARDGLTEETVNFKARQRIIAQLFNFNMNLIYTCSAGLAVGIGSGIKNSMRMLKDRKNGRLPPSLVGISKQALLKKIMAGHMIRGVIAASICSITFSILDYTFTKYKVGNEAISFVVPATIAGLMFGNIKRAPMRTAVYMAQGFCLGGGLYLYKRVTGKPFINVPRFSHVMKDIDMANKLKAVEE